MNMKHLSLSMFLILTLSACNGTSPDNSEATKTPEPAAKMEDTDPNMADTTWDMDAWSADKAPEEMLEMDIDTPAADAAAETNPAYSDTDTKAS